MTVNENIKLKSKWKIYKFRDPTGEIANFLRHGGSIEEAISKFPNLVIGTDIEEGNVALLEGLYLLCGIISGIDTTSPRWDAANAYLGVGDSTTAESSTQTGLLGANKMYKSMDSGFPQRAASPSASPQFVRWRATFGPNEANFTWNEFTVANGSSDAAVNLNRKVVSKGTKTTGETWTLELEITFG